MYDVLEIRDRSGRVINEVDYNRLRFNQFSRVFQQSERPLPIHVYNFLQDQRRILSDSLHGLNYMESTRQLDVSSYRRRMNSSSRRYIYDEPENYRDDEWNYDYQKRMHEHLLRAIISVLEL